MSDIPPAGDQFTKVSDGKENLRQLERCLMQLVQATKHGTVGAHSQAAQAALVIEDGYALEIYVQDIPPDAHLDDGDFDGVGTLFHAKFVLQANGDIAQVRSPNRWSPQESAKCLSDVETMVLNSLVDKDRQRVDAHLKILRMQSGAYHPPGYNPVC